jgi:hypothetical protein
LVVATCGDQHTRFLDLDISHIDRGTTPRVRVNVEGTSYGYSPFLVRRGADADDILLITFLLTSGVSSLRLIDDEELEALSPDA